MNIRYIGTIIVLIGVDGMNAGRDPYGNIAVYPREIKFTQSPVTAPVPVYAGDHTKRCATILLGYVDDVTRDSRVSAMAVCNRKNELSLSVQTEASPSLHGEGTRVSHRMKLEPLTEQSVFAKTSDNVKCGNDQIAKLIARVMGMPVNRLGMASLNKVTSSEKFIRYLTQRTLHPDTGGDSYDQTPSPARPFYLIACSKQFEEGVLARMQTDRRDDPSYLASIAHQPLVVDPTFRSSSTPVTCMDVSPEESIPSVCIRGCKKAIDSCQQEELETEMRKQWDREWNEG